MTVPFDWQHGEPFPPGAREERYATANDALAAMAQRGRDTSRIHIEKPPPRQRDNAA